MYTIKAKPITKDFWILQKDNKKVGQVVCTPDGYTVKINGGTVKYNSLSDLKENTNFTFKEIQKPTALATTDAHGYPTCGVAYNALWNLRYKLPLYTQKADSRSWFCAGYYIVKIGNKETVEFCPKLITLQRNNYSGPFKEKPQTMFEQLMEVQ